MEELIDNLKREGAGGMIERGLDPATGSAQSFDFFASPVFRRQIAKVYSYAGPRKDRSLFQSNNNESGDDAEKMSLARAEMSLFLKSFIDQQPTPTRDGLRYIVRNTWLAEKILNVTPAEFRANEEPKCILHPDNDGFLSSTFLGIELDLFLHDILCYTVAHLTFSNVAISLFCTWAMHLLRTSLRSWFGKANLGTKSLIDKRFLA